MEGARLYYETRSSAAPTSGTWGGLIGWEGDDDGDDDDGDDDEDALRSLCPFNRVGRMAGIRFIQGWKWLQIQAPCSPPPARLRGPRTQGPP